MSKKCRSGKKILLVEDDELNLEVLSLGLDSKGFCVDEAVDGVAAIEMLKANRYDLLVTDLVMEKVGGLELAAWAKEQKPDLPIILMTGHADLDSAIGALQFRLDEYLVKPVELNDLVQSINHSIEKATLKRQLRHRQQMLECRDEMLNVINSTAADLLANPGDSAAIALLLRRLGEILKVDRVSHYQCESRAGSQEEGGLVKSCRLRFQWLEGDKDKADAAESVHADNSSQDDHWLNGLLQGKVINGAVTNFSDQMPLPPVRPRTRNLLFWPIRHGSRFFGFIGFERWRHGRPWSTLETESLRMAVMIIAGACQRLDTETQLAAALDKARAAVQAKSDFLANMSHEIRTPMNSIMGMAQLLKETRLDSRQIDYLSAINKSSKELLGLLENILDFAEADAGDLKIKETRFNLHDCLQQSLDAHTAKAEAKGLSLDLDVNGLPSHALAGDVQRFCQVLSHLISNAIKFTDQGKILVQATSDGAEFEPVRTKGRDDDGNKTTCYFSVKDEGQGIIPDKIVHIFDLFSQVDGSLTRNHGGTGIGLALCRSFIVLMGGRIDVRSEPAQGSEFIFSIPFTRLEEELIVGDLTVKEDQPEEPSNLSILLVEDNQLNRELAIILLQRDGHRVTIAENGAEALQRLAESDYDRILMDVQMPVMDGLTATGIIRLCEEGKSMPDVVDTDLAVTLASRLQGKHLPIIAMTANAMAEDQDRCLAAGMDAYLTKPFQPAMIASTLASF